MRGVTPALSACRRPLHRRLPGEWQAYCVTAAIARNARARDRPRTPAPENPQNINLRQSPKQRRARDLDAVVPARGRERLRLLGGRRTRPIRKADRVSKPRSSLGAQIDCGLELVSA